MTVCAVLDCRIRYKLKYDKEHKVKKKKKEVSYHRFPKDKLLEATWVEWCNRADKIDPRKSVLCSEHFTPDDFERDLQHELLGLPPRKRLKKGAIPTIFPERKGMTAMVVKSKKTKALNKEWEKERKAIVAELLKSSEKVDSNGGIGSDPLPEDKAGGDESDHQDQKDGVLEGMSPDPDYDKLTRDDLLIVIDSLWQILAWKNKKIASIEHRIQQLEEQSQIEKTQTSFSSGETAAAAQTGKSEPSEVCSEDGIVTDNHIIEEEEKSIAELEKSMVGFCTFNQANVKTIGTCKAATLGTLNASRITVKSEQEPEKSLEREHEAPPKKIKKVFTWKCEKCDNVYPTQRQKKRHKREEHRKPKIKVKAEPVQKTPVNKWRCEICKDLFDTIEEKLQHKRDRHTKGKWKCKHCEDFFKSRKQLRVHINESHPDARKTSLKCEKCDKTFPTLKLKCEHKRAEHRLIGIVRTCPHCSKEIRGIKTYAAHLIRHSGERPFRCPDCEFATITKRGLDDHQRRVHDEVKAPEVCMYCGRIFKNMFSVRSHEKKYHEEALKNTCHLCLKVVDCVARHVDEVHNNISKFVCHLCPNKYKKRSGLNHHLFRQHNQLIANRRPDYRLPVHRKTKDATNHKKKKRRPRKKVAVGDDDEK